MHAESSKLSAVSDNIANSDTTGYKEADTQFSTLVLQNTGSGYSSGSVDAKTRYNITQQGDLQTTTSKTDLAIKGDGFFVVANSAGQEFLTRDPSRSRRMALQAAQRLRLHAPRLRLHVRHAFRYGQRLRRPRPCQHTAERRFRAALHVGRIHEQPAFRCDRRRRGRPAVRQRRRFPVHGEDITRGLRQPRQLEVLDLSFTKTAENQWESLSSTRTPPGAARARTPVRR